MIPIAIAHGQLDALRLGVLEVLGDPDVSSHTRRLVRDAVKEHAGVEGTDEEIVAWYRANEGNLSFDRGTKMFQVAATP